MTTPDWKNPDDYAFLKEKVKKKEKFDFEAVAWEFLRRNAEFVMDCNSVADGT